MTHILNKGYDGNDFANFMSQKKQGGNDINNFSFDEVLEVSLKTREIKRICNLTPVYFSSACLFLYDLAGLAAEERLASGSGAALSPPKFRKIVGPIALERARYDWWRSAEPGAQT